MCEDRHEYIAEEPKSRSQQKREIKALVKLCEELLLCTDKEIKEIKLSPKIVEEILLAKSLKKHNAKQRQIHYIGKLIRLMDGQQSIQDFIERKKGTKNKEVRTLFRINQ